MMVGGAVNMKNMNNMKNFFLFFTSITIATATTATAQTQWCNANGECITQLKNHKLINVPQWWFEPEKNVIYILKGAKNVEISKDPEECDELAVSPSICKKD